MQFDKDNFKALIDEEAVEGWNIVANDDPCIGTYKTKERALEVLDEIQKLLMPKIELTEGKIIGSLDSPIIEENSYKVTELSTYVYEMPKDEEE